MQSMGVGVKRVYEQVSDDDGLRVLVDRLWPRGIRKDDPRVDVWLKDIAPSEELRHAVHASGDWKAFTKAYAHELDHAKEAVDELRDLVAAHDRVTLVYAVKDTENSNAFALRDILKL